MGKGARNRARRNRANLIYKRDLTRARLKVARLREKEDGEQIFTDMIHPESNLWRDLTRKTRRARRQPVKIKY